MAVTKTNFINYTRCPRYVALANLERNNLKKRITFSEYKREEDEERIREILGDMGEGFDDLTDVSAEHLKVMLPYYNKVETLAGSLAVKYFPGIFKFSSDTFEQESFECLINNIRYLCYVDIYNETDEGFNIIEVKATTSKKFLDLGFKVNGRFNSLFLKGENGIYYLNDDFNLEFKDFYEAQKKKLFDRFSSCGHYVYDLAVQRYIIERDLRYNGLSYIADKVKYYLAVLNADYVFDGEYENGEAVYNTDCYGNDIVCYFDMTSITKDYLNKIDLDRIKMEKYIKDLNDDCGSLGEHCERKKSSGCKFCDVCFRVLPMKNSIMSYLDGHHGFKDGLGNKYDRYDLINNGYVHMLDVPFGLLNRKKNIIQREVLENGQPYINVEKIKDGLKQIKYPIYHLDFETFPCPLPRYKGERCYSQSVFQFSLHVEHAKGVCDKNKDHFEYLAVDHLDHRLELIESMCKLIGDEGTVLVYNESFEKSRLKELADIFPVYKEKLLRIRTMVFDLMNIVKTKRSLYESLGYSNDEAGLFNYYHEDLDGSYSIKKVLPLFSSLTYDDMFIGNGVEALIAYANFLLMNEDEYKYAYQKLIEYCKQDTWAMVCVLDGLRKLAND